MATKALYLVIDNKHPDSAPQVCDSNADATAQAVRKTKKNAGRLSADYQVVSINV